MADSASKSKFIGQFPGYGSNRDPHDSPEVALDVTNVTFHEPGKMNCRKGSKPIVFSNNITEFSDGTLDVEYNVMASFPYRKAGVYYIVHEDSNGNVRIGRVE